MDTLDATLQTILRLQPRGNFSLVRHGGDRAGTELRGTIESVWVNPVSKVIIVHLSETREIDADGNVQSSDCTRLPFLLATTLFNEVSANGKRTFISENRRRTLFLSTELDEP